jgi:outer membrane protein OmpA-like peptidoglycan-associated protein
MIVKILLSYPYYQTTVMKVLFAGIALFCSLAGYSQKKTLIVHFDFNKYSLTDDAKMRLDSFLRAEKENLPGCLFNLDGYCDFIGSGDYNKGLSLNRVFAVKKYLLSYGIEPGNFGNALGHGEKDALNENKTEEERQLNRRVEISLVKVVQASLPVPGEVISLKEKIADTTTTTGTTIVLKNINFFGGTPYLLPESFSTLDELLEIMRVNHKLVIEIQGHICCVSHSGDSPYGATGNGLSEERARSIYAELTGKGIEPNRVFYKGFGHSQPVYPYPEKNEEERIANRRVEIKIISK